MKRELCFTDKASEMLLLTSLYIENKFSRHHADKFIEKAYKTFDILIQQPFIFRASSFDEDIRIGIINKNCSFFYQVQESRISILFLWDNRQEPIV